MTYECVHAYAHNSVLFLATARFMTPALLCNGRTMDVTFLCVSLLPPARGTTFASRPPDPSEKESFAPKRAPFFPLGLVRNKLMIDDHLCFGVWGVDPFARLLPGVAHY